MPSTRQVLQEIEGVLNAHRLSPVPSFIGEELQPQSIADGSYAIGPGPSTATLSRGCLEGDRTFRISVLFKSRPHGEEWKVPDMLDKEDALSRSLLELEFAESIEADYSSDEGRQFARLELSLLTRYEREGA
jgi:hypothetical protein